MTVLNKTLDRESMFPKAYRGASQVSVRKVIVMPVGCMQINAAQVPRVVANDHLLRFANPGVEHVGPIVNPFKGHAVAADQAPFEWQEVNQKAARINNRRRLAAAWLRVVSKNPALPSI